MANTTVIKGVGWSITQTDAHTSIPYGPADRPNGERNYGFFDLCDHPEWSAEIPEAQDSVGLQAILRALAVPGFRFMSLGCARRPFRRQDAKQGEPPYFCGGYIQLAYRDSALNTDPGRFVDLAKIILAKIGPSTDIRFEFTIAIERLRSFFEKDGCYALMVQPRGYGDTEAAALAAWDHVVELVAAVFTGLHGTPSPAV